MYRISNLQEFEQKIVPIFIWRPEITSDIREHFDVVRSLVKFSYYEYKFLDVAFTQALMGFEMALAQRYEQLTRPRPNGKPVTLGPLIKWGREQSIFEVNDTAIDALKSLRNTRAHPRHQSTFGILILRNLPHINDMINCLYDDVQKRKERQQKCNELNEVFAVFEREGGILQIDGVRTIVFRARLLFYDNRDEPGSYFVLFWNIFRPEYDENKSMDTGRPIVVETHDIVIGGQSIEFRHHEHVSRLEPISGEANLKRFDEFRTRINSPEMTGDVHFIDHQIAVTAREVWIERNKRWNADISKKEQS